MSQEPNLPQHIKTTETLLRFYVLLGQFLDRCRVEESSSSTISEGEFHRHLVETKTSVTALLGTNRVVAEKVSQEYERFMQSGSDLMKNPESSELKIQVEQDRDVLRTKSEALSDLLAVFRSV